MVKLPPSFTTKELVNKYSIDASNVTAPEISPAKFSVSTPLLLKPLVQPEVQLGAAAPFPAPVATPSSIND